MTEEAFLEEILAKRLQRERLKYSREALEEILQERFGQIPEDVASTLTQQPSLELLRDWRLQALRVASMAEFRAHLRR